MSAFIDTNVLIRHLTGDPPEMAARATPFLMAADQLLLADLIVAEMVYVLESFYEVPAEQVAQLVRSVIAFEPISVVHPALLLRALEVYEVDGLDFTDAYLVSGAEASDVNGIVSFDRAFDDVATVSRLEP